jgi:hypothetical protein
MPIVDITSPLAWSEASIVAVRTKELLDSFVLLHGRFKPCSVRESPAIWWVICEKINTVVDCIRDIYWDYWNHQVSQVDRRVWWLGAVGHNHLISIIFSLWFHIVNNPVENLMGKKYKIRWELPYWFFRWQKEFERFFRVSESKSTWEAKHYLQTYLSCKVDTDSSVDSICKGSRSRKYERNFLGKILV